MAKRRMQANIKIGSAQKYPNIYISDKMPKITPKTIVYNIVNK
jgi:hypothetical protein